jgi:hypothetical protein
LTALGHSSKVQQKRKSIHNFRKTKVFHFNRRELETKINSKYFPTAIAVDENGMVIQIQYGLHGGINYEILKFLTTHDI